MSEYNSEIVMPTSKIAVVGVGGGGGNAINRMMESQFKGVDFIAVNTDIQDLRKSKAPILIQIGEKLTQGLGAGANPDVGQRAAEESREVIKRFLQNANLVIITAGMGKGTGTGASPVVASIAKELGKLVVAVVTKPFYLEGKHRIVNAEIGIENLSRVVDSYIVVSNEKLVSISNHASMADAFAYADGVLRQCILGISDVILNTQALNIDFADLCTVLRSMGRAYLGIGSGSGENRVMTAVREAVGITLQDTKISNATSVMLYVKAKRDVTLEEIDRAAVLVKEVVHKDANIIFGFDFRDDLPHDVEIMLIATGLGQNASAATAQQNKPVQPPVSHDYTDILEMNKPKLGGIVNPPPRERLGSSGSRVNIEEDDDDDVPAWLKETRNNRNRK